MDTVGQGRMVRQAGLAKAKGHDERVKHSKHVQQGVVTVLVVKVRREESIKVGQDRTGKSETVQQGF